MKEYVKLIISGDGIRLEIAEKTIINFSFKRKNNKTQNNYSDYPKLPNHDDSSSMVNVRKDDVQEDRLNLSLLDLYFNEYQLTTAAGFIQLLRKIEVTTEISVLHFLNQCCDEQPRALEQLFFDLNIEVKTHPKSQLRDNEVHFISKESIDDLMASNSLINDSSISLYDQCEMLIRKVQEECAKSIIDRFQKNVEHIKQAADDNSRARCINTLKDAISQRLKILEIKNRRS